jgi:very-short-patch-repair endonuclease/predicted transcriptional regulator
MDSLQCMLCSFSDEKSILSHIRNTHSISAKDYRNQFPNAKTRVSWMDSDDQSKENFKKIGRTDKIRVGPNKLKDGQWSKNYERCVICLKTDSKHMGHGICKKCLSAKQQLQKTNLKNKHICSSGVEGEDFVICKECGNPFECLMTSGHLKLHNITEQEYQEKHGKNSTRPTNLINRTGNSISIGRHKLMKERGYLNSQTMRDNKRIEMIKSMSVAKSSKTSSIEYAVEKWLSEHNFNIQFYDNPQDIKSDQPIAYRQFPFIGKYVVDFAIPSQKIIIEVLGTFWHGWSFISGQTSFDCLSEAARKNVCTDKIRFVDIIESGWTYVELWEHDINAGKTDSILSPKISHSDIDYKNSQNILKLVSAKPIANTPRKLYNLRWYAHQNNITLLPGLSVTEKELEILTPLVLASGDERAIPYSVISEYFDKIHEIGFPYYQLSPESMLTKWLALKNNNVTQRTDGHYLWDGFGTDLASVFHPHLFECKKRGKLTPLELFNNRELLEEAIYKVLCLYGFANSSKIREICRNDYKSSRVNNFPPKVAITVARLLLKDNIRNSRVLDPCAGFGGRLLGFSAAGVKSYTGIDLSRKTFDGLQKETEFLKSCGSSSEITLINGDCICEMTNMIEAGEKFDLIMTSPPFKDKEEYVGVPFYTNMKKWTDEFVEPFLAKTFMLVEDGGFLALYLGRTEKDLEQLPKVVDSIAESLGFIKCEPINFLTAVGESIRNKQNTRTTFVGVWKKDSP